MPAPAATRLSLPTIGLLLVPPLMWAGNVVVGRAMQGVVPPVTLNFLRWALTLILLLPLASWVLRPGPQGMWPHWRRFLLLGALSIGCYNALQYMALATSTPINVTLVATSMPVWMLLVGRLFYGVAISRMAALGSVLSIAGVVVVLSRGDLAQLRNLELVPGDALIVLASILWGWYSWLLVRPRPGTEPAHIKADWAAFLLAQVVMGTAWSGLIAAGEWLLLPPPPEGGHHIQWGWPLAGALVYVAVGASLLAFRCWGAGVARVGPSMAAMFANLTPLFAALMSATLLGESPRPYHAAGFVLIVGGIMVSSRK